MTKCTYIVFIIFLITSCIDKDKKTVPEGLETLSFVDKRKDRNINSSAFFSDTTYIKLETRDDVLIRGVREIKIDTGYFFVQDNKSIFIFDEEGKFINKVGQAGEGPEEYASIYAFYIDRGHKQVCIFDHIKRNIFKYDYKGELKEIVKVEEDILNARYMEMDNDGNLFVFYPMPGFKGDQKNECQIVSNQNGKYVIEENFSPHIFTTNGVSALFSWIPLSVNSPYPLFITSSSNKIYSFKNNKIAEEYLVELPGKKVDSKFLKGIENSDYYDILKMKLNNRELSLGVTGIANTADFILLSVNNTLTGIWDKKQKKGVLVDYICNDYLNHCFQLLGTTLQLVYEDKLIGTLDTESLFNLKENIQKGNTKLKKVLANSQEDDNPIICIYSIHPDCVNNMIN